MMNLVWRGPEGPEGTGRLRGAGPGCGARGRCQALAELQNDTPAKSRMQFDWMKFQQSLKTLEFQHYKFIV